MILEYIRYRIDPSRTAEFPRFVAATQPFYNDIEEMTHSKSPSANECGLWPTRSFVVIEPA